jgi:hypothetical protein
MSLDGIFRRLAPTLEAQRGEPVGHPSRKLGILNARLLGTGSSPARFLGRRRGRLALVFTPGASPGNRQTKFTCQRAGSRGFRIGEILTLGGLQDLSVESAAGAGALSPRHECRGTSRFLVVTDEDDPTRKSSGLDGQPRVVTGLSPADCPPTTRYSVWRGRDLGRRRAPRVPSHADDWRAYFAEVPHETA